MKPTQIAPVSEDNTPAADLKSDEKESKEIAPIRRSISEIGDGISAVNKKVLLSSQSFPSLSDHVLRQLGLWLEEKKPEISDSEPQSEVEVESSFNALLLAFQTDRLTLKSRLELQNRLRDQAEQNMTNEIQQLQTTVMRLCDKTEELGNLQVQIDMLHKAALRVSSAAEIFGAVQQENRLSKAVDVILRHVENLKQAYHKEKTEHGETKKVLSENKPANVAQTLVKPSCRRRATIAVGVAQNGTNLRQDTVASGLSSSNSSNPLEASASGQKRTRSSLSQRDSLSSIDGLKSSSDKQTDKPIEARTSRSSSFLGLLNSTSNLDNRDLYYASSDTQLESEDGNESDGSQEDSSPSLTNGRNRQRFKFPTRWSCLTCSTDDLLLHARYGLAAILLIAAVAVFCSTLYS